MTQELHCQLQEYFSIWKQTDAVYKKLAQRSNLSESGYWVFYAIYEMNDHITQKDICDQWSMSKQTVNSALKEIEKAGFITLKKSERDKRSKIIELTESGQNYANEFIAIVFQFEERTWKRMTEDERKSLILSSQKYLDLFRKETEHLL